MQALWEYLEKKAKNKAKQTTANKWKVNLESVRQVKITKWIWLKKILTVFEEN